MSLEEGYRFLDEDCGLIKAFNNIKIPDEWHKERCVTCTDAFSIKTTHAVIVGFEDRDHQVYEGESVDDDDVKVRLLKISKAGSCSAFAKYLYDLIVYIQD